MTNEEQTITFEELEEEKKYFCCVPSDPHVLEVVRKDDDRIIYEICDDEFGHVGTSTPERWSPDRYKAVESIPYDVSVLNEL